MSHETDLTITICVIIFCAALGVFSFRRHFAEHDKLDPRMVPWIGISLACLATSFMAIVHLINLFGLETGGRM